MAKQIRKNHVTATDKDKTEIAAVVVPTAQDVVKMIAAEIEKLKQELHRTQSGNSRWPRNPNRDNSNANNTHNGQNNNTANESNNGRYYSRGRGRQFYNSNQNNNFQNGQTNLASNTNAQAMPPDNTNVTQPTENFNSNRGNGRPRTQRGGFRQRNYNQNRDTQIGGTQNQTSTPPVNQENRNQNAQTSGNGVEAVQ